MNTLLISPLETLEIAFLPSERVRPKLISDVKIEAAQLKYIKPVLGKLYDSLMDPQYEDFVNEFLKLPLALYVKALVIDDASASIGSMGATIPAPDYGEAVPLKQLARLKRQTISTANTLLNKAIVYIEQSPALFAEYTPQTNIKNKITYKGGIII